MKVSQKIFIIAVFITLASGMPGCHLGKDKETSPTLPTYYSETSPSTLSNFYAMLSEEEDYCAYVRSGEFRFDALAGEYLLTYTTDAGEFKYVLRALEKSLITIGIPVDDALHDVVLYSGIITNTAISTLQVVKVSGPVTMATWPGVEQDAIILDPTAAPIQLIVNGQVNPAGKICQIPTTSPESPEPSPAPSPAPSPVPTPTPTPAPPDLDVTLAWEEAMNLTLLVVESVGGWASEGHDGVTALSTGDNMCGFGDFCLPEACMSDLTCNEPERVYVPYGEAISGFYTISVDVFGTVTNQNVEVDITTSTGAKTFTCTIPANSFKDIAEVAFPGGTIQDTFEAGLCTVN